METALAPQLKDAAAFLPLEVEPIPRGSGNMRHFGDSFCEPDERGSPVLS
jgi:hypothetical protein